MPPRAWPPDLALLIPAYQASASLDATLQGLLAHAPAEHVLVVDDGSTDGTEIVARKYGVTVIRHTVNRGKGTALATGLSALHRKGYRHAITLDADGQHDPRDLQGFLDFLATEPATESGPAALPDSAPAVTPGNRARPVGIVVGARRRSGTAMPWHRRFSNASTTWLISLLARQPVFDAQSGYRMYRIELAARGVWPAEGRFEWEPQALVLCHRAGYRIASVSVATVYGEHGSHMRLLLDTLRFLRMIGKLAWMR